MELRYSVVYGEIGYMETAKKETKVVHPLTGNMLCHFSEKFSSNIGKYSALEEENTIIEKLLLGNS